MRELRVVIIVTKKKGTMSKIMKIVTNIKVKFMTFAEVTVELIYIQNDLVGQALAWCLQLPVEYKFRGSIFKSEEKTTQAVFIGYKGTKNSKTPIWYL